MRTRFLSHTLAALLIITASLFLFPGQSSAISSTLSNGNYEFRLNGYTECLHSNGAGNQLTIESNSCLVVNVTKITSNPVAYTFNVGSRCIRGFAAGTVGISSGSCDNTVSAMVWIQTASNPYRFENFRYSLWMETGSTASGSGVYLGTDGHNNWAPVPE